MRRRRQHGRRKIYYFFEQKKRKRKENCRVPAAAGGPVSAEFDAKKVQHACIQTSTWYGNGMELLGREVLKENTRDKQTLNPHTVPTADDTPARTQRGHGGGGVCEIAHK